MHTIFIYEHSSGRLTLSFVKSDYVRDNSRCNIEGRTGGRAEGAWDGGSGVVAGRGYDITLHHATSRNIMWQVRRVEQQEVQWCNWKMQQYGQKASSVAGMCNSMAEDIAVQWMPRGCRLDQARHCRMLWDGGGSLSSQEMLWKGRREVGPWWEAAWKTGLDAEDMSRGGRHLRRWKVYWKAEGAVRGGKA